MAIQHFKTDNPMFFVQFRLKAYIEDKQIESKDTIKERIEAHSRTFLYDNADYDYLEEKLTQFVHTNGDKYLENGDIVTLSVELMDDFVQYLYDNIATIEPIAYQKDKRNAELRFLESYVYDKSTDELIECNYGEHSRTIAYLLGSYLLAKYDDLELEIDTIHDIPKQYHKECDEYVNKNIELRGSTYSGDAMPPIC